MPDVPLSRQLDRAVLVRVSGEILELLKDGKASPVIVIGVQELDDGTYDMILQTPQVTDTMVEAAMSVYYGNRWLIEHNDREAATREALEAALGIKRGGPSGT